jgi:hypothetical protein
MLSRLSYRSALVAEARGDAAAAFDLASRAISLAESTIQAGGERAFYLPA